MLIDHKKHTKFVAASLLFLTVSFIFPAKAQTRTNPFFYSGIGLLPEIRLNESGSFKGASYSYMAVKAGVGLSGYGFSVGMDGNVEKGIYTTKAGVWAGAVFIAVGLNAKLSLVRHFVRREDRFTSIRPELGLMLGPVGFNYGVDIFPKNPRGVLDVGNFIFTTYIPLFKIKEHSLRCPAYGMETFSVFE